MYSIRFLTLVAMMVVGLGVEAADPITPEIQQELIQKANDWNVPQPAPGSRLVKIFVYQSPDRESGKYVDYYALGFVDPADSSRALVGFDWWKLKDRSSTIAVDDLGQLRLNDVVPASPFSEPNGVNFGLVTGIQFLRCGDQKLGSELIAKGLDAYAGHARSHFFSRAGEAPALMLARSCLANAVNHITSAKPDFAFIKSDIESLLMDEPKIQSKGTDWVLESLQANVDHQSAPDGTMEQIIDDYLLCGSRRGLDAISKAERTLMLKGLKAVPSLLLQRHSKRFSNHLMQGFNNFPSRPMTSGEVIEEYLQQLANGTMESKPILGTRLEDDAVRSWWQKAQELGEENYVKEYVFARDRHQNWRLSDPLMMLVSHRYSHLLPDVYRKMLRTSHPSWSVADEIMTCNALSAKQKFELLQEAVATNNEAHRNSALRHLRKLDSSLFEAELIRLLKQTPDTPAKAYWTNQDASLSRFVAESDDLEVWVALHELIDRADLGMTMELISHLYPRRDAPPAILDLYYEIYMEYRDDPTIRDESSSRKYSGPGAGFPHRRLALRDFIHMHWSRWLKTGIAEPEEGASDDEWARYRTAVHAAVMKNYSETRGNPGVVPLTRKRHLTLPDDRHSAFVGSLVVLSLIAVGIVVSSR